MSKKNKKEEASKSKKAEPKIIIHPVQYLWGVVVALLAFTLYINTYSHEYVLDDSGAITENQYVQEGIAGIPKLMKVDFWHFSNIHLGYYRPLSLITFATEQEFFQQNPHISHLINVLIFSFSCFLLFIVLSKIFKTFNPAFAFLIALLYAAHPIHTEVVANIKSRDELLSFMNIMTMFWYFLKYIDSKKLQHLIASLLFCYLGMLSKETALTGVLLLPLILFYYTELSIVDCIKNSMLPLVIVFVFFIQKKYLLGSLSGIIPNDIVNYPYTQNSVKFPTTLMLFLLCLKLLFFPITLSYDYSYNQIPAVHMNSIWAIAGLIIFAGGAYLAYKEALKKSVWGFAIALFYITLIPSLSFTILRGGIFAERFLFFPSLGFCIALVYAGLLAFKSTITTTIPVKEWLKSNIKISAVVVVIIALYSFKTIDRNMVWKDNFSLFSTDAINGKNSAQIHRHLGNQYVYIASQEKDSIKKSELGKKAITTLKKALEIYPKFGEAYYLTGAVYQLISPNNDSAIYYYNKAIQHAPGYAVPYYNMGIIYQMQGQYNVASFYYNEAIKYNPTYKEPQIAAENLRKAGFDVHINPLLTMIDTSVSNKDHVYYFNLGNHYAAQSDYQKAADSYLKSLELKPGNENVLINLSNCYGMLKQYDKGIAVSNQILSINPNSKLALKNLSIMYNMIGNKNQSEEYMSRLRSIEQAESKGLY